jgi:putative ATP-dependent endonuclease of OLD family
MHVVQVRIENFRGIAKANLLLPAHAVLVGDNNCCKSTILEAIDLALGPERASRQSAIDEHDFYAGRYLAVDGKLVPTTTEVVLVDLSAEQTRHFCDHLEWWNTTTNMLLEGPPPEATAAPGVVPALRVQFVGSYDPEEDGFIAKTYFQSPTLENGERAEFRTRDKRICGFLFLRPLRTGSRALSLERGSSLDIILNLKEVQLQMWEKVLQELRRIPVAEDPELGLSKILKSVQDAVRILVPSEWADEPRMRVSDLTRETLRKTLTVFMATGAKGENDVAHSAPFQHQGSGTVNILVLAMLSLIAEQKQNVIFAMEEPEIAIPPHTQKRVVNSVRNKSAQALFTSHSPYVLEEFPPEHILVVKREAGNVSLVPATFPAVVKPKHYRQEWRTRFAEALLARRVLLAEGHTEYHALPAAARRLHHLDGTAFKTLEALGIAVVNAGSDSQIAPLAEHFRGLGKKVFAVFDQQAAAQRADIIAKVDYPFESPEHGFETLVINHTAEAALRRFGLGLVARSEWPLHLAAQTPTNAMSLADLKDAIRRYLEWSKGAEGAAELLEGCAAAEMPEFIRTTILRISEIVEPPPPPAAAAAVPVAPAPPPAAANPHPAGDDPVQTQS